MAKHETIDRATPVIIVIGSGPEVPQRTTWGQFIDDNGDAIDVDEVGRPGHTYLGGGGASAMWTIMLAEG